MSESIDYSDPCMYDDAEQIDFVTWMTVGGTCNYDSLPSFVNHRK